MGDLVAPPKVQNCELPIPSSQQVKRILDALSGNEIFPHAKAGSRPYPPLSKRYDQIAAAIAIDENAALNSASWGLPQIMGFNHRAAGFQNAKAMVASMLEGEGRQIEAFANLLSDWKLCDALRNRDWRPFALRYNGPNALKHGYDKNLRAAFEKYSALAALAVAKPGTNKSFVFLSGF